MHRGSPADGGRGGLRQAQEPDLAGPDQFAHRSHGVLDGHLGINPVLVVQVNDIHAEALQAGVAAGADVFGPAVHAQELALGIADVAELRGEDHLVATALDRPAHQTLVLAAAVHVGGVEEVQPQVEGAVDGGDGFPVIAGAVELRHAHAAEAQRGDRRAVPSEFSLFHRFPFHALRLTISTLL